MEGNITPELCDALSRLSYAECAQVCAALGSLMRKAEARVRAESLAPATLDVTGAELMERFASDDPSLVGSAASEAAWGFARAVERQLAT